MDQPPWERELPTLSPTEALASRQASERIVDLRRCIGCHACSVACKVEHSVPLGEFRMRVRWMEAPDDGRMNFLPVFDEKTCDLGEARASVGKPPACVAACPTEALIFGGDQKSLEAAKPLGNPGDTKQGVRYIGHHPWQESKLNAGVALHADDEDIIYEQGRSE